MHPKLTRRSLLKAAVSVAAAPAVSGFAVMQKSLDRKLIVGVGDHVYEVTHDWLTPPPGLQWGDTHGVVADRSRRIYIAHTVGSGSVKRDAVCVFDDKGKFVKSWGSEFAGGAHGLDLRRESGFEFLYHCDINRNLVVKTDLDGRVLWSRGAPVESGVYPEGKGWKPTNVAFAPDGDLFVGDGYGSSYVHRYSANGDYKGVVIGPGSEPGKVREPHGLWVDSRGGTPKLLVCDRGNRRLQEFTLDGRHLGFVTEGMRRPCHVHTKKDLALVPDLEGVLTILDKDNKVVASLCDGNGDPDLRGAPREQFRPGRFVHPHGAAWINGRDIVVVEWVPIGRVTLLRKV